MAAATRSRSSVLPPKPPPGLRPTELPRLPRTEVASLWRLHALPPRRRRTPSPRPPPEVVAEPPTVAAARLPPNAFRRTRSFFDDPPTLTWPPKRSRPPSPSPPPPPPPSSSRGRTTPARKRSRRTRHAVSQSEAETVDEADVKPPAKTKPTPPLPHDVLLLVLRDAAALCPRSAFGCRLVSRGWREAATEPSVQAILWRRCVGEEPNAAEAETESALNPASEGVGDRSSETDDDGGGDGGDGDRTMDVAEALARVERDILVGRDRGRLDDGAPVRRCVGRRWWRAAETLLTRCNAVDRNLLSPYYDVPDTYEDEVLDAAVDAGETSLCLALLRCPQTAVGIDGWPHHAPASSFADRFDGPPERPRSLLVFHAAEALRVGRIELASALVRPRDQGGGGQIPTPLLRTLCCGAIPWTDEMRTVLEAVKSGMIGRRNLAQEMYMRKHDRGPAPWDSQRRKWDRYERLTAEHIHQGLKIEVLICTQLLENIEPHEGTSELQDVLDRLKPIMNTPLEQDAFFF